MPVEITHPSEDNLPTLVTYRSAIELRDAGIRYAYLKSGTKAGLLVTLVTSGLALHLEASSNADGSLLPLALLFVGLIAGGIAAYCGKTAEFPASPRLTLEELDTMRDNMGLSPEIFRQVQRSVLHGSFAEHKAAAQADAIINQVKRASNN